MTKRTLPIGLSLALLAGCSSAPSTPMVDAGATVDGHAEGSTGAAPSRCAVVGTRITCTSHTLSLPALLVSRTVHYELPTGDAPNGGWPVVFFFQGSFVSGGQAFTARVEDPFGEYNLTLTIKALLDAGYAVLAPEASLGGTTAWQTNIPPWDTLWVTSSDDAFMRAIFAAIADGRFGAIDDTRMFAMGISSGGFMTSRMAVSYAGRFRALAIHSGSYATCGAICSVPTPLPNEHPPTLFLHGRADTVVPVSMMELYRDELEREGHSVSTVLNEAAGHEWIDEGPQAVLAWFEGHP